MKQPSEFIILFETKGSGEQILKIQEAISELRKKKSLILVKETINGNKKIIKR